MRWFYLCFAATKPRLDGSEGKAAEAAFDALDKLVETRGVQLFIGHAASR
jgi:hypothetical protein